MDSIEGHFDGQGIVLDEPVTLAIGQKVLVIVDDPKELRVEARRPKAGFARGLFRFNMRDDFDDPLDDFAEYR